jgi:O-phospho-L-seryl-tRNASec:L-selenocysteinyl-tRNA synthase
MLVLLTLRPRRPPTARYVVWTRIDQKTCFKAIRSAGLEPVVVENQLVGDCVCTDLEALKRAVESLPDGIDSVLCIASTTRYVILSEPEHYIYVFQNQSV